MISSPRWVPGGNSAKGTGAEWRIGLSSAADLLMSFFWPSSLAACQPQHATHSHTFKYSSSPRSSKGEAGVGGGGDGTGVNGDDSFGVETRGQVMLVPWPRFEQMVQGLEAYVGAAMVAQA